MENRNRLINLAKTDGEYMEEDLAFALGYTANLIVNCIKGEKRKQSIRNRVVRVKSITDAKEKIRNLLKTNMDTLNYISQTNREIMAHAFAYVPETENSKLLEYYNAGILTKKISKEELQ